MSDPEVVVLTLFLRRRSVALIMVALLVTVAAVVPAWCAVTGTWGW